MRYCRCSLRPRGTPSWAGIAGLLLFCTAAAAADPDLDSVVTAHMDSIGLLRNLDVTIDFDAQNLPDKRTDKAPLTFRWRWSMQGQRERLRTRTDYFSPTVEGLPTNLVDVFEDGRERKILTNYDPKAPQEITPVRQGTIKASIEPQTRTRSTIFPDPTPYLGLRLQFNDRDVPRTLAELRRDYPAVTLEGKGTHEGHAVWRIRAVPPSDSKDDYMLIDLDPTIGYGIVHITAHNGGYRATGGGPMPFVSERTFSGHSESDGVFIPTRVDERVDYVNDGTATTLRATVAIACLNSEMPPDAFDFRFPKYACVRHLPPVGRKVTVDVWGEDGPVLTTNDPNQIFAYSRANGLDLIGESSTLDYPRLIAIGIAVVLGIAVLTRAFLRRASRHV